MKDPDAARSPGRPVQLIDATGPICSHRRHCPRRLVQRRGKTTPYPHHVLGAKWLGPTGFVASPGGEKKTDPRLPFVPALDGLYGCGPVFAPAGRLGRSFAATFKEGRTPAWRREYRALSRRRLGDALERPRVGRPRRAFRWVKRLAYEDDEGRGRKRNALQRTGTDTDGARRYFARPTPLPASGKTVEGRAQGGGRYRWKVGDEGFNRRRDGGWDLGQVYGVGPERWEAYYPLLRIAFFLIRLPEGGGLPRRPAEEAGRPVWGPLGGLKNVARRPVGGVRFPSWEGCVV